MRSRRAEITAAIVALLVTPGSNLAGQQPAPAVAVMTGRIVDTSHVPIEGATITATPLNAQRIAPRAARTAADGSYRIAVDGVVQHYRIDVVALGYTPQSREVSRRTVTERNATIDFTLVPVATRLDAVKTVGTRPIRMRDDRATFASPGSDRAALDRSSGLSGDLTGDLAAALAMVPGVTVTEDPNGEPPKISAFGLSADETAVTLNGAGFAGASPPRDGLIATVALTTYDPKVGRGAGLNVDWRLPSGSYQHVRAIHLTATDSLLEATTPASAQLGGRSQDLIASANASGEFGMSSRFYNGSFQFAQTAAHAPNLASASTAALDALGVSPDSVARALAIDQAIGLPALHDLSTVRGTTTLSGIGRLDLTAAANSPQDSSHILYLLGAGTWSRRTAQNALAMGLPLQWSTGQHDDEQGSIVHSAYFRSALAETKATVSRQSDRSVPLVPLPAASVLVTSALPNGSAGVANLLTGGSGTLASASIQTSAELSQDFTWKTWDRAHTFDVYADLTSSQRTTTAADALGDFTYLSLADLDAGRPSRFVRTLGDASYGGRVQQATVAFGDIYAPRPPRFFEPGWGSGDGLTIQYGLRADAQRFPDRPSYDPRVDSLYGLRTDHVPGTLVVAPMAGFVWNKGLLREQVGPALVAETRHTIIGGIREYEGVVAPDRVFSVSRQTGLPGATQRIDCVGSAVPTVDWNAYGESVDAVPDLCADGTAGSPLSETGTPVTVFAPDYTPTRSWRSELRWQWLVSDRLNTSLGSIYSRNARQGGTYDANFDGTPHFRLPSEDDRPVFVNPDNIDPASGAVSFAGSRLDSQFANVTELRSDLRSWNWSTTAGVSYWFGNSKYQPPLASTGHAFSGQITVSYTHTADRAMARGFDASTDGDPRTLFETQGAVPAHSFQLVVTANVARWVSIGMSGRLSSGWRYTPLVGSDINGDGYANDRAFIFDPDATANQTVSTQMASLLAHAPHSATACLAAQLGRIAAPNSCTTPWSATLNTISIRVDPYRFGLGNRGALTFYLSNALGGLDQLLHGSSHIHGWGQAPIPDQTLLNVTGFQAGARQYTYAVNPLFGSDQANRTILRAPFRLTVDFRLDVSPDPESEAIKRYITPRGRQAPDSAELFARFGGFPNPVISDLQSILQNAKPLQLTADQSRVLTALAANVQVVHDSIFRVLAGQLQHAGRPGSRERDEWHAALAASLRAAYAKADVARHTLTANQWVWLDERHMGRSLEYSSDWLATVLRGPLTIPR